MPRPSGRPSARAPICGPTLIEHFTYRAEAHSTCDDPGRIARRTRPQHWPLGDPIERLKQHLIALGEWDEASHDALQAELAEKVRDAGREAEKLGVLSGTGFTHGFETMFEDVFEEMPRHLEEQSEQMAEERRVAGV